MEMEKLMKKALITGANRGIGYELCKQLSQKGYEIIAVCRTTSSELQALNVKTISSIDLTQKKDINILNEKISDHSLDLVINNAGLLIPDDLNSVNEENFLSQLQVNTLAPLMLTQTLINKFKNPSKLIMITSRMGSIQDNTSGGYYGYRASKAALNAVSKCLTIDLKPKGIALGILHPGYVQTGMTRFTGDITPDISAKNLIERIEEVTLEKSGFFKHSNGELLPW